MRHQRDILKEAYVVLRCEMPFAPSLLRHLPDSDATRSLTPYPPMSSQQSNKPREPVSALIE
jgi:hypothetical protein